RGRTSSTGPPGGGTWPGCRRSCRPSTTADDPPRGRNGSTGRRGGSGGGARASPQAVNDRRRPTEGEERLDGEQARFEALALRLRTVDGLAPEEARALGVDPGGEEADRLRDAGLLAPGPGLALTEKGMFLHGEAVARLA